MTGRSVRLYFCPYIYISGRGSEVNPKDGIIWSSANKSTVFGDFEKPWSQVGMHSKPGELLEKLQFTVSS